MSSARSVCLRAVGFKTTRTRYSLAEVEQRPLQQLGTEVDGDAWLPVIPVRIENLPLVGVERATGTERGDSLLFEVARDSVRSTQTRVGLRPLLGEAATSHTARRRPLGQLDEFGLKPARPHKERELLPRRPRDQLLNLSQERVNGVARGTLRAGIWRQHAKAGVRFLERVAAAPQQPRREALLAQVLELVEVDLERALVPAKLPS